MELVTVGNAVAVATKRSTAQAVANVAALLPPKTTDDMPAQVWMRKMVEAIGEHPQEVLDEAYRAVISTCTFAPTAKEFIDAVLIAYARLKVPMSEDAKRHLSYRKKANFRYVQGDAGRQLFSDDIKLISLGYFSLAGVHANMVLEAVPEATVTDVERAIVKLSELPKADKNAKLADSIEKLRRLAVVEVAYRKYGPPSDFCGGTPSETLRSPFLVISCERIDEWRKKYLYVKKENIESAFYRAIVENGYKISAIPDGYGTEWQQRAEWLIEKAINVADEERTLNQTNAISTEWRSARHQKNDDEMKRCDEAMNALRAYAENKGYPTTKMVIDKSPPITLEMIRNWRDEVR